MYCASISSLSVSPDCQIASRGVTVRHYGKKRQQRESRSPTPRRFMPLMVRMCMIGILCQNWLAIAFAPSRPNSVCPSTLRGQQRNDADVDADAEPNGGLNTHIFGKIKSATGKAVSKAKEAKQKGESDASSVASSIANLAGKGRSGVKSAFGTASSGIAEVVKKGGSDLKSVAGKGVSVASNAASSVSGFAEQGASHIVSAAGATTSFAKDLAKKGTNDAGNVVKWIDAQAKNGTEAVNNKTKETVLGFTGKEEYKFGDVTKETVRRIAAQEVTIEDAMLVLKILVAVGSCLGPIAKVLPVTILLEALNVSLEKQMGGKILEVLAKTLDERFVTAFTAEQLGDVAKRSLLAGILTFTGKESYESGDIERAVEENVKAAKTDNKTKADEDVNSNDAVVNTNDVVMNNNDAVVNTNNIVMNNNDAVVNTNDVVMNDNNDVDLNQSDLRVESDDVIINVEEAKPPRQEGSSFQTPKKLEISIGPEFEEWDKMFRESYPDAQELVIEKALDGARDVGPNNRISPRDMDIRVAAELEAWDAMFEAKFPDSRS